LLSISTIIIIAIIIIIVIVNTMYCTGQEDT
jgi:hypothetical protein